MSAVPRYTDFDVQIGEGRRATYPVSVLRSPAGETASPTWVTIPLEDADLRQWLVALAADQITQHDLQALGQTLVGFLLPPGSVRSLYQQSLGMAQARHTRLRVRMHVAPPMLGALPWEYVCVPETADFAALDSRLALLRYYDQPVPARRVTRATPFPILVMVASPADMPPLDVVGEISNLLTATDGLLKKDQLRLDVLCDCDQTEREHLQDLLAGRAGCTLHPEPASLDALRSALRSGYRVLHFAGHAGFDAAHGGFLLLTDASRRALPVFAPALAREMNNSEAALVVLNACQSAVDGTGRAFVGLAPALIRAGVPAVVAMQYLIQDASAVRFAQALYRALADEWPLDAAVTEARKAISTDVSGHDSADWGIPVLFMRSADGRLWKRRAERRTPPAQKTEQVTSAAGGDNIEVSVGNVEAGAMLAIGSHIQQTAARSQTTGRP